MGVLPCGISHCVVVSAAKVPQQGALRLFRRSCGQVETCAGLEWRPHKEKVWKTGKTPHFPAGERLCSRVGAVEQLHVNSHRRRENRDPLSDLPTLQREGATSPAVEEGGGVDTPLKA